MRQGRFGFLKRAVVELGVFSAVVNLLLLVMPLYLLQVYDRVLPASSVTTLVYLSILAVVAVGVMGVMEVVRAHYAGRVAARLDTPGRADAGCRRVPR